MSMRRKTRVCKACLGIVNRRDSTTYGLGPGMVLRRKTIAFGSCYSRSNLHSFVIVQLKVIYTCQLHFDDAATKLALQASRCSNPQSSIIMPSDANRITPTKRPRNIRPSPHIMDLITPTPKARNTGKIERLGECTIRRVDDEHVSALG